MESKLKEIFNQINGVETEVPNVVWENIENILQNKGKRGTWLWIQSNPRLIASIGLLLIGIGVFTNIAINGSKSTLNKNSTLSNSSQNSNTNQSENKNTKIEFTPNNQTINSNSPRYNNSQSSQNNIVELRAKSFNKKVSEIHSKVNNINKLSHINTIGGPLTSIQTNKNEQSLLSPIKKTTPSLYSPKSPNSSPTPNVVSLAELRSLIGIKPNKSNQNENSLPPIENKEVAINTIEKNKQTQESIIVASTPKFRPLTEVSILEYNNLATNSIKVVESPSKASSNIEFIPKSNKDTILDHTGLYVNGFVAPNIAQVYYNNNKPNDFFGENAVLSGKIGYTFGLNLGYKFSKRWSMESGAFISQYINSLTEKNAQIFKYGLMYIDQVEIPFLLKYSIAIGGKTPKILSFKGGLIYGSVFMYQLNYEAINTAINTTEKFNYDLDKRVYNDMQLGYMAGGELEQILNKRFSIQTSLMFNYMSQLTNFPLINSTKRPKQFSSFFSIGLKYNF